MAEKKEHSFKVVAIAEKSAGNERVGDMWKETKIFNDDTPIGEVMEWVGSRSTNVTLTVPENDSEDFKEACSVSLSF